MAGVAIRLPSARDGLGAWAEKLRVAAASLEPTIAAIVKEELETAVTVIKRLSPVKTGLFRRSWKVEQRAKLRFAVIDTAPYAEWVHKRGEKGSLFWETYAQPEVMSAYRRSIVRIRDEMREMLRARTARVAMALPATRSLRAMGRVRL